MKAMPAYVAILGMAAATVIHGQTSPTVNKQTDTQFGDAGSLVTDKYLDGLGRLRQVHIQDGDADLISGVEYDDLGRPYRKVKAFPGTAGSHEYYSNSLSAAANDYFNGREGKPNAEGFAFSQTEFDKDPYGRVHRIGSPGLAYSIGQGKEIVFWRFGRASDNFLPTSSLTVSGLDGLADEANANYTLLVTRDQNGNFAQAIKNKLGYTIKVWGDPTKGAEASTGKIITSYEFDGLGRTLRLIPHDNSGSQARSRMAQSTFSTTGQALMSDYPDAGVRRFVYDRLGQLRFAEDSRQAALGTSLSNYFTVMKYDAKGRMIEMGVFWTGGETDYFTKAYANDPSFPTGSDYHLKIRHYYDDLSRIADEFSIPATVIAEVKNPRGNTVGSVTYDESGSTGPEHRVVELLSHDEYGKVITLFKWIPTLPMQRVDYSYTRDGQLASMTTPGGGMTYAFDGHNRLVQVNTNGTKSVSYEYDEFGRMDTKYFYRPGNSSLRVAATYISRDLHNLPDMINNVIGTGQLAYREFLKRETASQPRYDGSLGGMDISYQALGYSRSLDYTYDGSGRIVSAKNTDGSSTDLDEALAYDVFGRIKQKRKGSSNLTGFSEEYQYEEDGSRLQYISQSQTKGKTPSGYDNFVYDPNGNLVLDRSKKMVIVYDWRNYPVSYKFFDAIPDMALNWSDLQSLEFSGQSKLAYRMDALYDVAGNRVLKRKVTFQ